MYANVSFQLFSSDGNSNLGFSDSEEPPLPPPPPCIEVLSSEVSSSVKCTVEPVNFGGLTLLKGRVNAKEVFGLPNSDLVPGVYEGSLDLVKVLHKEVELGNLSFTGKRVLELGCGHGLPGIFACLAGAAVIHFQDFNAEVLRCLTIPNLNANLSEEFQPVITNETDRDNGSEQSSVAGYDVILMAETIYSISAQRSLYGLIKKLSSWSCIHGMAAKKHYFGVGGGTRQFLSMVEKEGCMVASLVTEVTDGSSNVREVWKLSPK